MGGGLVGERRRDSLRFRARLEDKVVLAKGGGGVGVGERRKKKGLS